MQPEAGHEHDSRGPRAIDRRHVFINHTTMSVLASTNPATGVATRISLEDLEELLMATPWVTCSVEQVTGSSQSSVWDAVRIVADRLGPRVAGRAGRTEEEIEPFERARAHPRSTSAITGLSAMPLHIELSHRAEPCRYVVLGCLRAGTGCTATRLVDRRNLNFSEEELSLLRNAPFLVRSGRNSFYATILPRTDSYIRYDSNCMEAVDDRGFAALNALNRRLDEVFEHRLEWIDGQILVIDNWRALHGREAVEAESGRRLARILING